MWWWRHVKLSAYWENKYLKKEEDGGQKRTESFHSGVFSTLSGHEVWLHWHFLRLKGCFHTNTSIRNPQDSGRHTAAPVANRPPRQTWPITLCATVYTLIHLDWKKYTATSDYHLSSTLRWEINAKQKTVIVISPRRCSNPNEKHSARKWGMGSKWENGVELIFPVHMYKYNPLGFADRIDNKRWMAIAEILLSSTLQ